MSKAYAMLTTWGHCASGRRTLSSSVFPNNSKGCPRMKAEGRICLSTGETTQHGGPAPESWRMPLVGWRHGDVVGGMQPPGMGTGLVRYITMKLLLLNALMGFSHVAAAWILVMTGVGSP